MPYRVRFNKRGKRGKKWEKVKEDGSVSSRHASKAKALASIRAYYANRKPKRKRRAGRRKRR